MAPQALPSSFHPAVRRWFEGAFAGPTAAQSLGWAEILAGRLTRLLQTGLAPRPSKA